MNTFGLSQHDKDIFQKIVVIPLKNLGAKVFIFGSRARGDYKEFSDIDVLFELPDQPDSTKSQIYLIKCAAEESKLTLKIDMVEIGDLAASYKHQILKERVEI